MATQRVFIYVNVPEGMPDVGCFRLVEAPIPKPADGQVLARTHFLSIDPTCADKWAVGTANTPIPSKSAM